MRFVYDLDSLISKEPSLKQLDDRSFRHIEDASSNLDEHLLLLKPIHAEFIFER